MSKESQIASNKTVRTHLADALRDWKPEDGVKMLEIRTGEAQVIEYPVKVEINGVTSAPFEFFQKRINLADLHDKNKVHLLVDKTDGVLILVMDENYQKGTVVRGSVQKNKFLEEFTINTDTTFNANDLAKLLKTRKIWFTDPLQCGNIVHNLQHFKAQWSTMIQSVNNQKGITVDSLARTLESEVPLSFSLTIAPYKGMEQRTFTVDVCVEYDGSHIEFYLESVDLMTIQLEMKVKEIEDQVKKFDDKICIFEV